MGDRELLEWAARAVGCEVASEAGNDFDVYLVGVQKIWNPLIDDGDALRLAVKLGMEVGATHADHMATAYVPGAVQGHAHDYAACNGDVCAAMRRCIVRAAAEIGKSGSAASGQGGGV